MVDIVVCDTLCALNRSLSDYVRGGTSDGAYAGGDVASAAMESGFLLICWNMEDSLYIMIWGMVQMK